MRHFRNKSIYWVILGIMVPLFAQAHEAYVLPSADFQAGLHKTSLDIFQGLLTAGNIKVGLLIGIGILVALVLNFKFQQTQLAKNLAGKVETLSTIGPLILRLAIAASFFLGAVSGEFLGSELSIKALPATDLIHIGLLVISVLVLLGLFTRLAALAALIIFSLVAYHYHWYILTYLNYLGEIAVLLLFGSGKWSLDQLFFGSSSYLANWRKYETVIVRVCYGLALIYGAVSVKFLHPVLSLEVINNYHLTQFHWLFPSDPRLIVFGAALTELTIGLFILLGFQLRLTVLVTLFYITLSLLFFRELVWPHLLLYGISFNLLVQRNQFSLDGFLEKKLAS